MNLDDLKGQAEGLVDGLKEKAEALAGGLLNDESTTDSALDAVADAAKKVVPGLADKVDAARDAIDSKLGTE